MHSGSYVEGVVVADVLNLNAADGERSSNPEQFIIRHRIFHITQVRDPQITPDLSMTFAANKPGMCCSLCRVYPPRSMCVCTVKSLSKLPTSNSHGDYGKCNYFLSIWQHNQLIPLQSHYTPDCQMPNRNLYYLYLCLLSCTPVNSIVTSLVAFIGAMTLMSSDKWSEDPTGKLIFLH